MKVISNRIRLSIFKCVVLVVWRLKINPIFTFAVGKNAQHLKHTV